MSGSDFDVGIIGAGPSGAIAARILQERGIKVAVYEKSRGHGGRSSTRYMENDESVTIDHGAQYFTIRNDVTKPCLETWRNEGVVSEWEVVPAVIENGEVVDRKPGPERYVGVPTMNAPIKHLLTDIHCEFETKVLNLTNQAHGWSLEFSGNRTVDHDLVICTTPPEQAAGILGNELRERGTWLRERTLRPTWSYGLVLRSSSKVHFDAGFVNGDSPLDWIARNSSKPGRSGPETWIVHAGHEWSEEHLEDDRIDVMDQLREATIAFLRIRERQIENEFVHRWRYAKPAEPLEVGTVHEDGLFWAGDWLSGSRFEGALLSGEATAEEILSQVGSRS